MRELADLAQSGALWHDLGASVTRVALGFAIALVLALILGSLVGAEPACGRAAGSDAAGDPVGALARMGTR